MAKSRIIKTPDGIISLTGFSGPKADAIEALILSVPAKIEPVVAVIEEKESPVFSEIALGVYYNKVEKMYKLVEIGFDLTTKRAEIQRVENAGEYKAFAVNNFRFACVKKGLV